MALNNGFYTPRFNLDVAITSNPPTYEHDGNFRAALECYKELGDKTNARRNGVQLFNEQSKQGNYKYAAETIKDLLVFLKSWFLLTKDN